MLIQKTIDGKFMAFRWSVIAADYDGSAVMVWLANILKKQKSNDFKPKDEESSFARMLTEPCQACCAFLEKLKSIIEKSINGKNAQSFLLEIGMVFHA